MEETKTAPTAMATDLKLEESAPRQKRPYHRRSVAEKTSVREKKLKIVVYAISKNEAKFVNRWMDSMKEADEIVVLDTGSTDNTVELLKYRGVRVTTKQITPWRFDVARNESMDLALKEVPDADLLVCTDLDEFFLPGWRDTLERNWIAACAEAKAKGLPEPTTAQYEYVWNFNEDGSDGLKFLYEKIHTPQCGARWAHPVHEILEYRTEKLMVKIDGIRLEHHADPTKSRAQYLGLLEMSVNECPDDDRNMHYLGREYMFRQRWQDCVSTLKRHLELPRAKWDIERAASMRFIAHAYGKMKEPLRQEIYLWRAAAEAPGQREALLELAELYHANKDWTMLVKACELLLSRKNHVMCYLTDAKAWGSRPYDLLSVGLWWKGRHADAILACKEAVKLNPTDKRIASNLKLMEDEFTKNCDSNQNP